MPPPDTKGNKTMCKTEDRQERVLLVTRAVEAAIFELSRVVDEIVDEGRNPIVLRDAERHLREGYDLLCSGVGQEVANEDSR